MSILYLVSSLNLLISSSSFLVESLGFSINEIVSFANNDRFFTLSFPIWMPFISLSYLIALAVTSSTMWWVWELFELVPDCEGKAFILSLLSMTLAVGIVYVTFKILRYVPVIPNFLRVFIMKEYCILWNTFSSSIEIVIWFLFFTQLSHLLVCVYWTIIISQG